MDKENNMKLDADWQATTEEQGDIRSALNRMDVEAPDVDMAWKAMSQQMGLQEKAELRHSDEEKKCSQHRYDIFLESCHIYCCCRSDSLCFLFQW